MKSYLKAFKEDFEIPGIVEQKMENALVRIRMEDTMTRNRIQNVNAGRKKKEKWIKNRAAVIAGICLLTLGSISAYAAYHYFWSRGMQGELYATEGEQQKLVEQDMVTVFQGMEQYKDMAVTAGGVTITPQMMVSDERVVHLSLAIEGYDLKVGEDPCFEFVEVYMGEEPQTLDGRLNVFGDFYDGIITAEDGSSTYEDGTPIKVDENGKLISYYTDEDGKLEFILTGIVTEPEKRILGEELHVKLTNLGTSAKTAFMDDVEGEWSFDFKLPQTSMTELKQVGKKVADTGYLLENIEISPVSVQLNYDAKKGAYNDTVYRGRLEFVGVVLEDGTRYSHLSDGGLRGMDFEISAFERVIDPDKVTGILLRNGDEVVEVVVE